MTQTTNNPAAQVISLALGGISITSTNAIPNRWDGYDLDLENDGRLRITLENREVNVLTFDGHAMLTQASFTMQVPPAAIAAYVREMLG